MTNTDSKQKQPKTKLREAVEYLQELRPGGPWILTAIGEHGPIRTNTFTAVDEAREFISKRNADGANIYYAVNPTKHATSSKAKKQDISAVEYLHVDADPRDDESPDEFKSRMLPIVNKFNPPPTFVIDSGNGLQFLWRLKEPFKLTDDNTIAEIETRNHALALRLGADPSTRNIDRILRLPGTINFPTEKKRKLGRKRCQAKWIFDDPDSSYTYPLDIFHRNEAERDLAHKRDDTGSGHGFRFFADCKRRGIEFDAAREAILADEGEAGEWANRVDERQLKRAWERAHAKKEVKKEYLAVNAADVIPQRQRWLWPGHLLAGAQELITGVKGMGKSQVQCSLVACATTGRRWPNRAKGGKPGNVIMVTAEDELSTVVVPRLIVAEADLNRVRFLQAIRQDDKDRMFLLGEDIDTLEQMINDIGDVCLVTIDPITAFMGKINSSSPTDVRGQLGPLAKLAERTQVAISTITHPPKQNAARAIDNFIGSQAFIAAARIGHLCVPEMENGQTVPTGRNLFVQVASNHQRMPAIAYRIKEEELPDPKGLSYEDTIRYNADPITAPYVCWGINEVDITADEALAAASRNGGPPPSDVDRFLRDLLNVGPVSANEVFEAGARRGFSRDQLKRAKNRLNIKSDKSEFDGGWAWELRK